MPSKPRSLAGILRPRRVADAEYNDRRRDPVAARVYRSSRWTAVRAQVLRDHPLCASCEAAGRTELATQVDHVVPVRVRPDLAYDPTNCQPLCTVCHAAKSQAERRSGGMGGEPISHASRPESGRRGVSLFSRERAAIESGPPDNPGALHGAEPAGGARARATLGSQDVEAMAAVLAHVEGISRAEARSRIEAALARGEPGLEIS